MAEKTKEEMTEEYKKALAEKEAREAAEQKEATLKEMKKKQSNAKARREAEKLKTKMEEEIFAKKIAECDAEIREAEKKLGNKATYDLIGKVALYTAIGFVVMAAILKLVDTISMDGFIAMLVATFFILSLSVYFQTLPLFAEKKIRENNLRKKDLRNALLERKNRH